MIVFAVAATPHLPTSRSPGKGKFRQETVSGDDFTRSAGRWDRILQVVDCANNRYIKKIWHGETNELLRDTDEPLKDHKKK